jgi:hypothetical protein
MMKTAISKLFSAIFGSNFSNNALIKDIIQSRINKSPPKKEHLSLTWKLEDLISFLRLTPLPSDCFFKDLTLLSIVHLMVFRGVRFSEIHKLSPVETSPTSDGWKFWLVIKNHRNLHDRIQNKIGEMINDYKDGKSTRLNSSHS